MDLGVLLVAFAQGAGRFERLFERDVQLIGHELCNGIDGGVGHPHDAADVADCGARGHRAERDDLCDVVFAVFLNDIIDHFAAAVVGKVDVKIRHAHALGI